MFNPERLEDIALKKLVSITVIKTKNRFRCCCDSILIMSRKLHSINKANLYNSYLKTYRQTNKSKKCITTKCMIYHDYCIENYMSDENNIKLGKFIYNVKQFSETIIKTDLNPVKHLQYHMLKELLTMDSNKILSEQIKDMHTQMGKEYIDNIVALIIRDSLIDISHCRLEHLYLNSHWYCDFSYSKKVREHMANYFEYFKRSSKR